MSSVLGQHFGHCQAILKILVLRPRLQILTLQSRALLNSEATIFPVKVSSGYSLSLRNRASSVYILRWAALLNYCSIMLVLGERITL